MASQPAVAVPVESVSAGWLARVAAAGAVLVLFGAIVLLPDVGDAPADGPGVLAAGVLEQLEGDAWNRIPVGATIPGDVPLRSREETVAIDVTDGRLEFAPGANMSLADTLVELDRGSMMIVAPAAWTVTALGVTVSGNGAWRVDGGIAGRVAVYEGSATAATTSRDVAVPALFEATMINGDLAAVASPLRYLSTDAWDRRWLSDAIAIDRVVEQLQSGWSSQYPAVPQDVEFYEDFLAGLTGSSPGDVDQAVELLASRRDSGRFGPPVDVLSGLVFARALAASTLPDAAAEIVALRRAGATWGLTALLLGLDRADIGAAAEQALEERQQAVDAGTAVPPATSAPAPEVSSPPPPAPTTTPTPAPPPPPDPDPEPTTDPTDDGGDSLGNIVDEVGGLLSGEDDDVVGTLGDILDEVGVITGDVVDGLLG